MVTTEARSSLRASFFGPDLICYIALGPSRIDLDEAAKATVTREVREYLDQCVSAAERHLLGEPEVPDPRPGPIQARCSVSLRLEPSLTVLPEEVTSLEGLRAHPEYQDLIHDTLCDCDHEVEAEYAFKKPEELAGEVEAFVKGWNDGCFRDLSRREDPDSPGRKIVVAGELSWGDEPDGLGYQMLKKAFGLNIAQSLGVK